jgi:hypothetical protein
MTASESPQVHLSVPAERRWLRVVRLTTSGVAADAGLDVDAIEDLRVAIDEACAVLIEQAAPGAQLEVTLTEHDGSVEAEGRCELGADPELHPVAAGLLELLTERFELIEIETGTWGFSLTARTGTEVGSNDPIAVAILEYQATGDRRLRNRVVEEHLHVVEHHARSYSGRGVSVDDLRQVGALAVVRAVDRFDPSQGASFATFAGRTVDGELKRWFRDRSWSVRPPRRTQELHLAVRRATDELSHQFGRPPSVGELATHL